MIQVIRYFHSYFDFNTFSSIYIFIKYLLSSRKLSDEGKTKSLFIIILLYLDNVVL